MSTDTDVTTDLLPCGRDGVEVVDRARAGRTSAHERSCPYCRAAVDADSIARTAALEVAGAERDDPVPPTLLPAVMRSVWSDLRRSTMIPLTTDAGRASIADHTIAAVIEHALDEGTDLRIRTCVATLAAEPEPGSSSSGTIAITLTAAAAYGSDVGKAGARARDVARRTVAEQFGWAASPIDIDVVDLYVPDESPA